MSNEKRSFFKSGWYLTLVIFFALMLVLGATSTIWQIVSKRQTWVFLIVIIQVI